MSETVQKYTINEAWLTTHCGLGEAPFWEKERSSLRFVDIVNKTLFFVDLDKGPSSLEKHQLGFSISTTADIEGSSEHFIFGGKYGYGLYNRSTGESRWVKKVWTDDERVKDGGGKPGKGETREVRMRSNDGAVDVRGRYWVGAMNDPAVVGDDNFTDEGVLFRLDPDLTLHRVLPGVTIPNGTSWSLDNKTMYFTDSPTTKISRYPYNPDTGEMSTSEGKPFFTCPYEGGVPDGHCQDVEGYFWVACFGTGKVVRINTEGQIVAVVEVPTRCVTCPVICGKTLYICSAAEEQPDKYPESVKYQGCVFKIDIGVDGRPLNKFRLSV